jgi:type II secretory pathway pseudopilin PulG
MSSRPGWNDHGATLIETLVALALFGISIAAIGNLLTCHIRRAGTNSTYTTAVSMAEQEIEDLRSLGYTAIASRTTQVPSCNSSSSWWCATEPSTGAIQYTITTTVVPDSPATNMKSITIAVNWQEPNGLQTYTLNAIYTAVTQ